MSLDFRNTKSPYIGEGFIELFYIGELAHKHLSTSECNMDPKFMKFMSHSTFTQWAISESAMTCMANAFAKSEIGHIMLNKDKLNKMFSRYKMKELKFDTTSIKKHLPLFEYKMGKNKPLHVDLSFKDVNVLIGQYDTDLIFEYTMCLDFKPDDPGSYKHSKRG